jgi:hypothetical protein
MRYSARIATIAALLFLCAAHVALAQAVTGSCGTYSAGFTQLTQAITAFQNFFYGPFFKVGCLAAFAISGVVLLLDDGQIGRIGQLILRGILIVAFVAGAASFLNIGSSSC